jgi:hypothetical protein
MKHMNKIRPVSHKTVMPQLVAQLVSRCDRFIVVKPTHAISNLRFDTDVVFMTNYSFSGT